MCVKVSNVDRAIWISLGRKNLHHYWQLYFAFWYIWWSSSLAAVQVESTMKNLWCETFAQEKKRKTLIAASESRQEGKREVNEIQKKKKMKGKFTSWPLRDLQLLESTYFRFVQLQLCELQMQFCNLKYFILFLFFFSTVHRADGNNLPCKWFFFHHIMLLDFCIDEDLLKELWSCL